MPVCETHLRRLTGQPLSLYASLNANAAVAAASWLVSRVLSADFSRAARAIDPPSAGLRLSTPLARCESELARLSLRHYTQA